MLLSLLLLPLVLLLMLLQQANVSRIPLFSNCNSMTSASLGTDNRPGKGQANNTREDQWLSTISQVKGNWQQLWPVSWKTKVSCSAILPVKFDYPWRLFLLSEMPLQGEGVNMSRNVIVGAEKSLKRQEMGVLLMLLCCHLLISKQTISAHGHPFLLMVYLRGRSCCQRQHSKHTEDHQLDDSVSACVSGTSVSALQCVSKCVRYCGRRLCISNRGVLNMPECRFRRTTSASESISMLCAKMKNVGNLRQTNKPWIKSSFPFDAILANAALPFLSTVSSLSRHKFPKTILPTGLSLHKSEGPFDVFLSYTLNSMTIWEVLWQSPPSMIFKIYFYIDARWLLFSFLDEKHGWQTSWLGPGWDHVSLAAPLNHPFFQDSVRHFRCKGIWFPE